MHLVICIHYSDVEIKIVCGAGKQERAKKINYYPEEFYGFAGITG